MPSVYLAGPIMGQTYEESTKWREVATQVLTSKGIDCFSPLRSKSYLRDERDIQGSYESFILSSQRGIYARDMNDCRNRDALLINLAVPATKVSIGTVMEIAWGAAFNKPMVLIMTPDYLNGIYNHPMIKEACPFVVHTLEEGLSLLEAILLPTGH